MAEGMVNFLAFGTNGIMKRLLQKDSTVPLTSLQSIICGSVAGIVAVVVTAPADMVKIRLQLQEQSKDKALYKGVFDCVKQVFRSEGIRGLYYSAPATWCREIPAFTVYFGSYERSRRYLENKDGSISTLNQMLAGAVAGCAVWLAIFPIDMIKTNVQKQSTKDSVLTVAKQLYKKKWFKRIL